MLRETTTVLEAAVWGFPSYVLGMQPISDRV